MDPENTMEAISIELDRTLKGMAEAESLEEKRIYSEIVGNLTQSLGVYLKLASDMIGMDFDDFDEFDEFDD